jgi:RNA polymerase sigma-70 factor (ECF subfamily)
LTILIPVRKNQFDHITDQELLDHFYADHSNDWLGFLLQRYVVLLFGVCIKYLKDEDEAKDAVQQITLKAITELHKYRVTFFSSWIYMVTRNYCLMKLRDRPGKVNWADLNTLASSAQEDPAHSELLEKEYLLDMMSRSLGELNPEQKDCVTLFYLEKKSYQQIAEKTGFNLMQVKSYIQNGKRNLKILLDKKIRNRV